MTNISGLVEDVLLPHNYDVDKPRALKTFIDGLEELGINKRLIQNTKSLAELLEKEQAHRTVIAIKIVTLVIKKRSPKVVIMKTAQRQPLNIVNIKELKNPDLEPEGNSDVPFHSILKKPQIQRFCLKEKVLATVAKERTFMKEQ